jgi:hypothetical protein
METWAPFLIVDHRAPVYRQALALFDRIVTPIPREPIGDQTHDELTQPEAEISYLTAHDAAELHEWNSDVFCRVAEASSGGGDSRMVQPRCLRILA